MGSRTGHIELINVTSTSGQWRSQFDITEFMQNLKTYPKPTIIETIYKSRDIPSHSGGIRVQVHEEQRDSICLVVSLTKPIILNFAS